MFGRRLAWVTVFAVMLFGLPMATLPGGLDAQGAGLPNPSFEDGEIFPAGWQLYQDGDIAPFRIAPFTDDLVVWDSNTARSGTHSMLIDFSSTDLTPGTYGRPIVSDPFAVPTHFIISTLLHVRTETFESNSIGFNYGLQLYGADMSPQETLFVSSVGGTTSEWSTTQWLYTFENGSQPASYARFFIQPWLVNDDNDRHWLDDITLVIDDRTPTDTFQYPIDLSQPSVHLISGAGYNVQNGALTDKSKCYSGTLKAELIRIGQTWHAGEDYKGTTETPVFSVAAGKVIYSSKMTGVTKLGKVKYGGTTNYPGGVVIIEHSMPDGTKVYSMYGHLDPDEITVAKNDVVSKGQPIASGLIVQLFKTKTGFIDNTHLHWEMRYFADGSGIKSRSSNYTKSCSDVPGPGYTFNVDASIPSRLDNFVSNNGVGPTYRWTDPSEFVDTH